MGNRRKPCRGIVLNQTCGSGACLQQIRRCSRRREHDGFPRFVAHPAPAAAELGRSAAGGLRRWQSWTTSSTPTSPCPTASTRLRSPRGSRCCRPSVGGGVKPAPAGTGSGSSAGGRLLPPRVPWAALRAGGHRGAGPVLARRGLRLLRAVLAPPRGHVAKASAFLFIRAMRRRDRKYLELPSHGLPWPPVGCSDREGRRRTSTPQ